MIGRREQLEGDIVTLIEQAETLTKDNTGITVIIALNYGGRQDILNAAAKMAATMQVQGVAPSYEAAEEYFTQNLSTAGVPDPILIRTSGEQRISNFLLWQCAYSEMVFTPTLWPDFSRADLESAIAEFNKRDRRLAGCLLPSRVARSWRMARVPV